MVELMFDDQTTSRWIPRNQLGLPVQVHAQATAPRRATEDATWSRGMDHSAHRAQPTQTAQVRRVVAHGSEQPTHRRWPAPPPAPPSAPAPRMTTQPLSHRIRTPIDEPRVMRADASSPWDLAKDVAAMQARGKVPLWLRSFLPGVALFAATLFGVVIVFVEPSAMLAFEAKPADAEVSIDGERIDDAKSPFVVKGLAEGEHTLLLQKTGFEDVRQTFRTVWGQTLRLPEIVLERALKQVAPVEPVAVPEAAPEQLSPRARRAAERAAAAAERAAAAAERAAAAQAAVPVRPAPHTRGVEERAASTSASASTSTNVTARVAAPAAKPHAAPAPSAAAPVAVADDDPEPAPVAKGGAGLGMLRINSRPWSTVSVDGRKIGNTPIMGVPLPAGEHEVVLVNESMDVRKTLQVKIKRDEIVTKVVLLVD